MTTPATYVSLAEVKSALRIPSNDSVDDTMLNALIGASSRLIDQYCDRYFGQVGTTQTPDVRLYRASGRVVLIDDLVSLSDVEVDFTGFATTFTTLGASSVLTQPLNAGHRVPAWPFTSLLAKPSTVLPAAPGWVRVSGVFGWPAVPAQISQAALLQTVRLFKSQDVPLGLVGGADMMGALRLPRGLHPDAAQLLADYRKHGGLA